MATKRRTFPALWLLMGLVVLSFLMLIRDDNHTLAMPASTGNNAPLATGTPTQTGTPPTPTAINTSSATYTVPPTVTLPVTTSTATPGIDLIPMFYVYGQTTDCYGHASFSLETIVDPPNAYVPVTTTMRFSSDGWGSQDFLVPPHQGLYSVNCTTGPCQADGVNYTLIVDLYNDVAETNEQNNTLTQQISFIPCTPSPLPTDTPPLLSPTPALTATPLATSTPACQPWAEVAQYPTTDFSLMATSLNGDVYGFGGRDASYTRLTSAYNYDPSTDQWTQLASMPQICFWCSAVAVNGHIWIVNGSHDQGGSKNSSVYDPVQNSWSAGTNGLVATYGQSVVYLNGILYRIGGVGDSGYTNTIEDYGQRLLSPMPQAVAWAQAVAIDGYIYVAGGSTNGGLTNKTYRYDPATDSWDDAAIADLPEPRGWAGSGIIDGRWVIVGGTGTEGSAVEWDPQTNSWSSVAPPLYPRSDMGAAVAGGKLYLIGGLAATMNEVTAQTQRYDPSACMTPTATATLIATNTATPTPTAVTTTSPTASPTVCSLRFSDVPQGSTFYPYIRCLACLGIVSGYPDGTFKPSNNVTRGQIAKIISNAAGFNDPQATQRFQDVPPSSTFFDFIGRLASRGFMQGYPCGGVPLEPCVPPGNLPYFRPNNNATRGQIAKIDTNTAGFNDTPSGQLFEDVPAANTYYTVIYRAAAHGVMAGYPCGGPGEPCVPPGNLPYFRPNNNATRGQSSKVVSLAFFPECNPRDGQ